MTYDLDIGTCPSKSIKFYFVLYFVICYNNMCLQTTVFTKTDIKIFKRLNTRSPLTTPLFAVQLDLNICSPFFESKFETAHVTGNQDSRGESIRNSCCLLFKNDRKQTNRTRKKCFGYRFVVKVFEII